MHPHQAIFGVVDFETTGFDPEKDRPCSFAAVRVGPLMGHQAPDEHSYRIMDPGIQIPAQASAVHHLTNKMLDGQPSPQDAMADWWDNDPTSRCHVLVAHNAEFDSKFMEAVAPGRASVPWLCTMRLAKKLWPDDEHSNNQYIRYQHNVEVSIPEGLSAHHALYDTIVTAANLRMLLGEYLNRCSEPSLVDILQIIDWTKEPILLGTCRFGNKHYGDPWKEVPRSYLRWMWSNVTDMDMDTRHTVAHYLGIESR